jgi:uncharacterized protein
MVVVACSAPGAATDVSTSFSDATTATPSPPTSQSTSTSAIVSAPTIPLTATTASTTTTAGQIDRGDLAGWETATITVGGTELLVAVANDPSERTQGLMGVDEMGDLDGMLFEFPDEAIYGFWMQRTLIALDIDFFGDDMGFVGRLSMVPCSADRCFSYAPEAPFSWALETPAGTLGALAQGAILSVGE